MASTERQLFGGSITCEIPSSWRDVSDIRQIPDHQECWQGEDGDVLVVEILERQVSVPDADAAMFFFRDLADANEVTLSQDTRFRPKMIELSTLPQDASLCAGIGFQKVAKVRSFDFAGRPRQQEAHWIRVELCAIRLQQVDTDLLVTISTPMHALNSTEATSLEVENFTDKFLHLISTLKIRDWKLFS